jgi:hypothetical protein
LKPRFSAKVFLKSQPAGAPAADLDVVLAALALRHIGRRRLRDLKPERLELGLDRREMTLLLGDERLELRRLRLERRDLHLERVLRVARSALELALQLTDLRSDLLRDLVLLAARVLEPRQDRAARLIERKQPIHVDLHALVAHAVAVLVGVLTQILEVDHGRPSLPNSRHP